MPASSPQRPVALILLVFVLSPDLALIAPLTVAQADEHRLEILDVQSREVVRCEVAS
jgi:hypothetical protein